MNLLKVVFIPEILNNPLATTIGILLSLSFYTGKNLIASFRTILKVLTNLWSFKGFDFYFHIILFS